MTVSEIIVVNTRFLCSYKGIKLGEIEQEIGVSCGYLSRLKGKKQLSVDKAYKIANLLDVGIDELSSLDLAKKRRIMELKEELASLEKEVDNANRKTEKGL